MTWIKRAIFYGVAGVVLLLQALDTFGLLAIELKFEELALGLLLLVSGIVFEIYLKIDELVQKQKLLVNREFEHLPDLVSPRLSKIAKSHIDTVSSNLSFLLNENTLILDDVKKFHALYSQTLEKFPNQSFLATSDLHGSKFWGEDMTRNVVNFCKHGGSIRRIFYISGFGEGLTEDDLNILRQQHDAGVDVSVVSLKEIPHTLYMNYMVARSGEIGWEVNKEPGGTIIGAKAHSHNKRIHELISNFDDLISQPCIKNFSDFEEGQIIELPKKEARR